MTPQPLLKDDLPNTNLLANEAQHKPLNDWFAWKQIEARFFYDSVDITGFFDEAAIAIGDAVRPTFKRYRTS